MSCINLTGPTNVKKSKSKKEKVKKEVTILEQPEFTKPSSVWKSEHQVAFDTLKDPCLAT